MIVALLGAECTGKSSLTRRLGERLAAPTVGEYLREWCLREGRTPRREEQEAIAAEQQRRIEALQAPLLIADTTGLMTAIYSQHYFGDDSLLDHTLAAHRRSVDMTLLCCPAGVPWQRDGCLRDGEAARQAVHGLLLALLQREAIPFELLQGPLAQRVDRGEALIRSRVARHNAPP